MSELPSSWVLTSLGDIAEHPQYGFTTSSRQHGTVKLLRITDISSGRVDWSTVPFCEDVPENLEKYILRLFDIVVARSGATVGSSFIINTVSEVPSVFASYLIRFRATDGVLPRYLSYYLKGKGYWEFISQSSSGIAQPNVNGTKLRELPVPLAPLNEQKRIVAKLDELLPKVETCKQRLEKIPTILKRFRQSVLAAAVSGRLTDAWRNNTEYTEHESLEFHYPTSWMVTKTAELFSFVTSGSRGWAQYYSDEGAIFLRIGNLEHDDIRLDLSDIQHVSPPKGSEGSRTRVQVDDLLVSITADVGMIAHVERDIGEAYINQHVALARPIKEKILPRFLALYLTCLIGGRGQFKALQRGATKVGLGLDDIRSIWVAVPPLDEQKEIVRRYDLLVDKLNRRCDIAAAERLVERASDSILSAAFKGELCRQDPTDEPASLLLERIKSSVVPKAKKSAPKKRRSEKEEQSASA
jgi:type I restriction enzyme S subunit